MNSGRKANSPSRWTHSVRTRNLGTKGCPDLPKLPIKTPEAQIALQWRVETGSVCTWPMDKRTNGQANEDTLNVVKAICTLFEHCRLCLSHRCGMDTQSAIWELVTATPKPFPCARAHKQRVHPALPSSNSAMRSSAGHQTKFCL
jgi:hypothetical protein